MEKQSKTESGRVGALSKGTGAGRLSRNVLKVMGLFTGMQSFNIVCSLIKMKIVAICLDTVGVGLFGIFSSAQETISTLTDMGLRQSAVRDVAANGRNQSRLHTVLAVVRRWSAISGLLGALVICSLSPFLADFLLGDRSRWWMFAIMSLALFMNAMVNGEYAIMQGTQRLRLLAKVSLTASVSGLVLSVPMFIFLGDVSVVLSFVVYALAAFVSAIWMRPREKSVRIDRHILWKEGRGFVRLGIFMAVAAFVASMVNLCFMGFLQWAASTSEIGLYQAGSTIIVRYAGLVFTAVSMEFYPRLAANVNSPRRTAVFVSHEILLLQLVLVPLILLFLLLRRPVIELLFSVSFLEVIPFVSLAIIALVFKAISWSMSYAVVARGRGKVFFIMEITDAFVGLVLFVSFYEIWGLVGIGWAFLVWYLGYVFITGYAFRRVLGLRLSASSVYLSVVSLGVCAVALVLSAEASVWIFRSYCVLAFLTYMWMLRKIWRRR